MHEHLEMSLKHPALAFTIEIASLFLYWKFKNNWDGLINLLHDNIWQKFQF